MKLDLEAKLELKRLELSQAQNLTVVGAAPAFRLENAIKLLPKFNEQNVEEYLIGFEKVAKINNWPQDCYAFVLHAMLVGKGLKDFAKTTLNLKPPYLARTRSLVKCIVADFGTE